MKVGASYYPEVIPREEWERDLATGREIGLSSLRCGEFAWSAFSPDGESWQADWAIDFLTLAHQYGYEVVWCTPSATPPPYLFDRWPDLHAVTVSGAVTPVGIRRNYCPSHAGYRELCANVAERLARDLTNLPAVHGWQVDNEIAGDGFTCWCPRCREEFHAWLQTQFGSLDELNNAWQTGVWSQRYTRWEQIQIPEKLFHSHAPALKLAYRRFRSDNWLRFYRTQYDALKGAGARRVTTNFYNLTWDMPFDQWKWRSSLDAVGLSHYLEEDVESRFQLAVLQGAAPGEKPLWVLEQKAGQQIAQNAYPDELRRIEDHLRRCAQAGAEYAMYWHLRQHSAGCEMEHGAVLRHDGKATRVARAVQQAIKNTAQLTHEKPSGDALLVFSFEQQWANENRPQQGTSWDYRTTVEQQWFAGACDVLGDIAVGNYDAIRAGHRLVLAPFSQLNLPGMMESLRTCLDAGGTVITTVDCARLDRHNNVMRHAPLAAFASLVQVPELEVLHMRDGAAVHGTIGNAPISGTIFWAIPDGPYTAEGIGELNLGQDAGPAALRFAVGQGTLIVALTALDRAGVKSLLSA